MAEAAKCCVSSPSLLQFMAVAGESVCCHQYPVACSASKGEGQLTQHMVAPDAPTLLPSFGYAIATRHDSVSGTAAT